MTSETTAVKHSTLSGTLCLIAAAVGTWLTILCAQSANGFHMAVLFGGFTAYALIQSAMDIYRTWEVVRPTPTRFKKTGDRDTLFEGVVSDFAVEFTGAATFIVGMITLVIIPIIGARDEMIASMGSMSTLAIIGHAVLLVVGLVALIGAAKSLVANSYDSWLTLCYGRPFVGAVLQGLVLGVASSLTIMTALVMLVSTIL